VPLTIPTLLVAVFILGIGAFFLVGLAALPTLVMLHVGLHRDEEQAHTADELMAALHTRRLMPQAPDTAPELPPDPEPDPFPTPRRGDFVDIIGTRFHGVVVATHDEVAWCRVITGGIMTGGRLITARFAKGAPHPYPLERLRVLDRGYDGFLDTPN
jgi:hypothetical protein